MTILLNLTPKEAKVLMCITQHIGGPPSGTRGLVDKIGKKLHKQRKQFENAEVDLSIPSKFHSIYFEPESSYP
jgi:hypothetical protein